MPHTSPSRLTIQLQLIRLVRQGIPVTQIAIERIAGHATDMRDLALDLLISYRWFSTFCLSLLTRM